MLRNIAAIVLNWKDSARTIRCVNSLRESEGFDSIVVVDNESDGSLRRAFSDVPQEGIVFVEADENLGFSAGVNLGIAAVGPGIEYLLVINNDAVLLPGCLDELVNFAAATSDLGVCSPVITNLDGSVQSCGETFSRFSAKTRTVRPGESPDFLTWACVLVPVSTIEKIGVLDEAFFMYWEDVDYGLRCTKAGLQLRVVESARVYHELSASHGKASSRIDMYSTLGLVALSRKLGGAAYLGMCWRVLLRLGKRLVLCDFSGLAFVLRGVWVGFRATSPAHVALRKKHLLISR